MANRDNRPLRGLGRNHSRRSGVKNAVSHYLPPPGTITSTAPQSFSNNLTMSARVPPQVDEHVVAIQIAVLVVQIVGIQPDQLGADRDRA